MIRRRDRKERKGEKGETEKTEREKHIYQSDDDEEILAGTVIHRWNKESFGLSRCGEATAMA